MRRTSVPLLAGSTLVIVVALLGGLLWQALAHAQWSSSRSSGGQVNAGALGAPTPTPLNISIDIKPGSGPNSTNLGSRGVIPVAILTTPAFDAADVDPETVVFEGASPVHHGPEDVDEDGDLDLVMHFRTQETEIAGDATEACLTGQTFSGQPVQGCDVIRIVPPGLDSDGDGFGDAVEASLVTDQFASCPASPTHDAWPPDADMDTDADVGDVIALFKGVILDPAGYQARSDFDADGDVDIGDLIAGFRDKILTTCG
jgi:hypothetical protein